MGAMGLAQRDTKRILTDGAGFAIPVLFTTPGGTITKTINAIPIKHSTAIDGYGATAIGKTARVNVSEEALNDADYPVRNDDTTIALKDHRVTWTDSSNIAYTYVIDRIMPSRTFGNIVCILGDYTTGSEPKRIVTWKACRIRANIVETPDPEQTQTLDNGDVIPLEYSVNEDFTITIPYLISVTGITVLTPFMLNENPYQNEPYSNGTFNHSGSGQGFKVGDEVEFNASLPIYAI
jgi:hypothetical protein